MRFVQASVAAAGLLLITGTAAAGWTSSGTGTAAAKAATLPAPAAPTATKSGVGAVTVTLTWPAVAGATGYTVSRSGGVGTLGGTCTGTVAATTCNDTPLIILQTYTYRVTATHGP